MEKERASVLSSRITVVPDTKSNQFQVGDLFHLLCYLMPQFDITDNCECGRGISNL